MMEERRKGRLKQLRKKVEKKDKGQEEKEVRTKKDIGQKVEKKAGKVEE